jgi:hypothetical protein
MKAARRPDRIIERQQLRALRTMSHLRVMGLTVRETGAVTARIEMG